MAKLEHEIRDPIHVFVRITNEERKVLNSKPIQRLRHITQLALTYLVYPGATHKRFEHSVGVMHLASSVFDVITKPSDVKPDVKELLPQLGDKGLLPYWRRVLRFAALCHDVGHLPFSHAAEKELLPQGESHETITKKIIIGGQMQKIWSNIEPPIKAEDIAKIAIGPAKNPGVDYSRWEVLLSEIITGDAFGVDRIDYLLRDSHHVGVPYGTFDHYRLIDNLRILKEPPSDDTSNAGDIALGMEEGAMHTAEALLLARYFMFSQLYYHRIRLIYDVHLEDFLKEWLPAGRFGANPDDLMESTDNEVGAALWWAAFGKRRRGHAHARRIVEHDHFKILYQPTPEDRKACPEAGEVVYKALCQEFGEEYFKHARKRMVGGAHDFPVLTKLDGEASSSIAKSEVLQKIPSISVDCVYSDPVVSAKAQEWLKEHRNEVLSQEEEGAA